MRVKFVKSLPERNRGKTSVWPTLLKALKARPGRWAVMKSYKTRSAAYSAATTGKKLVGREVEIVVRGQTVYARLRTPKKRSK